MSNGAFCCSSPVIRDTRAVHVYCVSVLTRFTATDHGTFLQITGSLILIIFYGLLLAFAAKMIAGTLSDLICIYQAVLMWVK